MELEQVAFEKDNMVDLSKSKKNMFNLTPGTLKKAQSLW